MTDVRIKVDSGDSGTVPVENVYAVGDRIDDAAVWGRRIEVVYTRVAFQAPDHRESVVAEQEGNTWRVTSRERSLRPPPWTWARRSEWPGAPGDRRLTPAAPIW